jgi:multidrug efflux pump subunit AcrB
MLFSNPRRPLLSTPIRPRPGATVYLPDIGTIENGTDIISAYAHVDGKRTVYIPVPKRANASTLAVINAVKKAIPDFKKVAPEESRGSVLVEMSSALKWEVHPRRLVLLCDIR